MKNVISIILSLLLAVTISAQSADSSRFAALGLKLEEYYDAMDRESLSVQQQECDFLIETATDSVLRQYIAQHIYDHYMSSKLMGAENVAVHVFDKWFADGNLPMSSQDAYYDAKVYADFNRQSLIGCQAPALEMEIPDGSVVNLFAPESRDGIAQNDMARDGIPQNDVAQNGIPQNDVAQNGIPQNDIPQNGIDGEVPDDTGDDGTEKFKILLFYDADCPKCRLQVRLLNALFKKKNYPVDLYAVYVGDDRQKWTECMSGQFDFPDAVGALYGGAMNGQHSDVSICHLWDPTLSSDFQRKYGVTQTPRMFLISPEGSIIGRGLDAVALEAMLDGLFAPKEMVYGSRESEQLFDGIFSTSGGRPSAGAVKGIADYVHDKTLAIGDTLMFKQLAGDYLYYLPTRRGEGFKEGLMYHIDKNILSQNKVWTTQDDSLKVVGFAQMMSDLLSRALPGTRITSVKVPGELYTAAVNRKGVCRKLDRLKGDENIIIFYTEGCEVCAAEKAAALKLLSRVGDPALSKSERAKYRNMKVFMVNVDALMASDPSLASRLMDSFDLSTLPFIIRTDRGGTVLNRYVSFQ